MLDVLIFVDYSRSNIYGELEDIRIPLWMATVEYRRRCDESISLQEKLAGLQ